VAAAAVAAEVSDIVGCMDKGMHQLLEDARVVGCT
jgi:hypothetical protein